VFKGLNILRIMQRCSAVV